MTKSIVFRLLALGILAMQPITEGKAQPTFPVLFKGEFPMKATYKKLSEDRSKILVGDFKEIGMVDSKNGKLIWKLVFKDKFDKRKCTRWDWIQEDQVVELTFKGEDKGEEKVILINEANGDIVEQGVKKVVKYTRDRKAKSLKNIVYVPEKNLTVRLSYKQKRFVSAKNGASTEIEVSCVGDKNWSKEIKGNVVRSLCATMDFAGFGGDLLELQVVGNKVFVIYDGISVLDLNTGALLWTVSYDNSDYDGGLFKQRQTLGRAALPYFDGQAVYIVDLSKNNHDIKKYDVENGNVLWKSPKFNGNAVVPELAIEGKVLLARFGGIVELQTLSGGGDGPVKCKSEPKQVGEFGLKAYNTETGQIVWETSTLKSVLKDKFSSSISNLLVQNKLAWVASDKFIYGFEPETGKAKFQIATDKMKVGEVQELFAYHGNIHFEGNKGVGSLKEDNAEINFAVNTGKCLGTMLIGETYYVWVGKNLAERSKFVRVDLGNGKLIGKIDDTFNPYFTEDGAEFTKFIGQKLWRYKTQAN